MELLIVISYNNVIRDILMTDFVTSEECNRRIEEAIRRHNRNASIISMWLGAFCLGAFTDGILRMIGKLPPFLGIDISII